jgi:hypothetical protein
MASIVCQCYCFTLPKAVVDGVVAKLTNQVQTLTNAVEAILKNPTIDKSPEPTQNNNCKPTQVVKAKNFRTVKNEDGEIQVIIESADLAPVTDAEVKSFYTPEPAAVIEPVKTGQEVPVDVSIVVDGKEVATTNKRVQPVSIQNHRQEPEEVSMPLHIPTMFGKK